MRKYLIPIILFLGIVLTIFCLPNNFGQKTETLFEIKKGEGAKEISLNLQKQDLIRWSSVFRAYVFLTMNSGKLQAGIYKLSSSMNIPKIAKKFSTGDTAKEIVIIPEGWNLKDIENKLISLGFADLQISDLKIEDFQNKYDFFKNAPAKVSLEGFLFPDTYQISYGLTAGDVATIMLNNFDKKLTENLRVEIGNQGKTIFEIITMASLIEKEVKTKEDKEIISGILWNRLKNKMPLQVDATISYITGKDAIGISIEETKIDSRYNTYKYRGLPLGPISNPGLESIIAAIYPKNSSYWYYLSTPEGETIFSKTLEEHNAAKVKYLK